MLVPVPNSYRQLLVLLLVWFSSSVLMAQTTETQPTINAPENAVYTASPIHPGYAIEPIGLFNPAQLAKHRKKFPNANPPLTPNPKTIKHYPDNHQAVIDSIKAVKKALAQQALGPVSTTESNISNLVVNPEVNREFEGNLDNGWTPPDNTIAISNSGWIVSIVNSSISFTDEDGNISLNSEPLGSYFSFLNLGSFIYDPRVLFDAGENKFIMVALREITPSLSKVIVGFSVSDNPNDGWWFYTFDGNFANANTWFDYPHIGVSTNDLFITGNLFNSNNSFNQSVIMQLDKSDGYAGQAITWEYFSNVTNGNGLPAFTLKPVSYGFSGSYGPGIYLISTLSAFGSEIYFYSIDNEVNAAQMITAFTVPSSQYAVGANGDQLGSTIDLDVGDCRVQSGFFANGIVHFVHNTDFDNVYAGIRYGRLTVSNLSLVSQDIGLTNYAYAYPAVAPLSSTSTGLDVVIGFNRTSSTIHPEMRAVTVDPNMNFSGSIQVKGGTSPITTNSPVARWGDYSGAARRHNAPTPAAWIFGIYGKNNVYGNWIAEIVEEGNGGGGCAIPTGLGSSNITFTTADLSWNAVTGATEYNVRWRETGTSTWSTGTIMGTTGILPGLEVCTQYEFQVEANCNGNLSGFTSSHIFITECNNSNYCLSYGEDSFFEWIQSITVGSLNNNSGNDGGYGDYTNQSVTVTAGESYPINLQPGFESTEYTEYWRIWIDLNHDDDFTDPGEMVFDAGAPTSNAILDNITIPASATPGATTMRIVMKWVDPIEDPTIPDPCLIYGFGETEDYTINIEPAMVACDPPTNATVTETGYSYFLVNFTPNASADYSELRYREQGTTTWIELSPWNSGAHVSLNKIPCTTYEWQARSVCSGNEGPWSGTLFINTEGCGDPYCYNYGNSFDQWIETVSIGSINNNSGQNYGYANFTNLSTTVETGSSYPITLTPETGVGGPNTVYWRVWVDFNQDNDFNDSGELVLETTSSAANSYNGTIDIPGSASTGTTRMRVSMFEDQYAAACNTGNSGETEDYSLTINSAPADFITINPTTWNGDAAADCFNVTVQSNASWSISGLPFWASANPTSGTGNATVEICYDANGSTNQRSATINFSVINGGPSMSLSLTQEGTDPVDFITINPTTWNGDAAADCFNVTVQSNASWSISGLPFWASANPTSGTGNATVEICYDANGSTNPRSATINFSVINGGPSMSLSLTQEGTDPVDFITINPTTWDTDEFADCIDVTVQSNASWSITGLPSWVSVSPTSGTGNATVEVCVDANASSSGRSASLEFGVINGGPSTGFNINQEGDIMIEEPWEVNPTGENHTVIVPNTIMTSINGQALEVGDYIGFFYEYNGELICAGQGPLTNDFSAITVYGNDEDPPAKNGFDVGETFKVKVYVYAQAMEYTVMASYEPVGTGGIVSHTDQYANDGISMLAGLEGSQSLEILLNPGWNMISSYVDPQTPDMLGLFDPIGAATIIVKNGIGQTTIPQFGINAIGDWVVEEGYKVKMSQEQVLTVPGLPVDPVSTPISIQQGWQIIAYLRDNPANIEVELGPYENNIDIVKNNAGQVYIPAFGINGIGNLIPTQGYQLRADQGFSLEYSQNLWVGNDDRDGVPGPTRDLTPEHFDIGDLNTGSNATIIVPFDILSGKLAPDDEIGVFSQGGILCGAAVVVENENMAITVWGDDATTTEVIEGMSFNEEYAVKVWQKTQDLESDAFWTFSMGDHLYGEDDIEVVEMIDLVTGTSQIVSKDYFSLYPNPSSGSINLEGYLPVGGAYNIQIITTDGRTVIEEITGQAGQGTFFKTLDVADYPNGTYTIKIFHPVGFWTKSFVKLD